jgi:hypothetical protein
MDKCGSLPLARFGIHYKRADMGSFSRQGEEQDEVGTSTASPQNNGPDTSTVISPRLIAGAKVFISSMQGVTI